MRHGDFIDIREGQAKPQPDLRGILLNRMNLISLIPDRFRHKRKIFFQPITASIYYPEFVVLPYLPGRTKEQRQPLDPALRKDQREGKKPAL
jgi:hypothetical protein